MEKSREYWENKHPKIKQMYRGRPLPNGVSYDMDVRHFIWPDDITLQKVIGDNHLRRDSIDETAWACQKFVVEKIKYVSDETLGCSEYWLFPVETWEMKQDDCEGGACLIASLILNAIPPEEHWRVRMAAGWVKAGGTEGGHGYCTYCRMTDNEFVGLDWCFLEDSKIAVKDKTLLKERKEYRNVWFSFNHLFAFSHVNFECRGRLARGGMRIDV